MRKFRLLRADEIECRISEIDKDGRYINLLLYKTARTDAALLDETIGFDNWCNDYKMLDGKLYCGIGIRSENGEWIWRWNVGTESNTEAEKGQASDAFKRAGFVIGIGTELYSSPRITVWNNACEIKDYSGKKKCFDRFAVKRIEYDDQQNIKALEIVNETRGNICFTFPSQKQVGRPVTAPQRPEPPQEQQRMNPAQRAAQRVQTAQGTVQRPGEQLPVCTKCGKPVTPQVATFSQRAFGRIICYGCQSAERGA